MTRTYWLDPSREPDEIAAEARSRINRYAERMQTSGRAEVMRRMSRLAFSRDADSGLDARAVQIGGEQGELIGTRDNQLGTLNRQVGNMVTSARPSYTARSIATSAESIMHVNVATALCDFMISRRGAEEAAKRAEMFMQLYGKGWGSVIWNERAGKHIGQDETGRKRYTGDIIFAAKRPDEVVEDIDLDETSQHQWLMVARQVSRWELAQQHPTEADYILSADTTTLLESVRENIRMDGTRQRRANGDMVTVYDIHHPPSCVLEEGFHGVLLGDRLLARDRATYDDLPCYEMVAEYEPGTKNGHSFLWDLCGLQQCSDSALTAIISTVENMGRGVLFIPEGSDLDTSKEALMQPFHIVRGTAPPAYVTPNPGILEPMVEARGMYLDAMVLNSGLNDVARGDASKSASGEALQTMHTLAMQSVSPSQGAYSTGFGEMMFGGVKRYRTFASEEQIAAICGKSMAGDAKAFKATLAHIETIDTEMGPASLRHSAGKREFADKMWDRGAIADPEAYLETMATGKVEPILGRPQAQRRLIEAENERLRAGQPVQVLDTDDHRLHIAQHTIVGDDVDLRSPVIDPATGEPAMQPVLDDAGQPMLDPMTGMPQMRPAMNPVLEAQAKHVMDHIEALKRMDPDLASVLGQEPVPSQVMQQQAAMQPPDPNAAAPAPNPGAAPASEAAVGLPQGAEVPMPEGMPEGQVPLE